MTQAGMIVGSPSYFAPEHIQNKEMTPQTDIYALGIVLYEILAGEHPFGNITMLEMVVAQLRDPLPDIRVVRPDLPAEVEDVIQHATQKDPADRFADVREMARAFQRAIQE
jgi:serine/threonine-protein kinase